MRTIRRSDRKITGREAEEILDSGEYGILSTVGVDGHPYGVPLSYVYRNNAIYFHCATSGHKIDNIQHHGGVSFCVVGRTKVLPDKFATEYESAIVFGMATEITGSERLDALLWLLEKYCPDYQEEGARYIERENDATKVFRISIKHISGKARK